MSREYCADDSCFQYVASDTSFFCFEHKTIKPEELHRERVAEEAGHWVRKLRHSISLPPTVWEERLRQLLTGFGELQKRLRYVNRQVEFMKHVAPKLLRLPVNMILAWSKIWMELTTGMSANDTWKISRALSLLSLTDKESANSRNIAPFSFGIRVPHSFSTFTELMELLPWKRAHAISLWGRILSKHRSPDRFQSICRFVKMCYFKTRLVQELLQLPSTEVVMLLDVYKSFPYTTRRMEIWRLQCLIPFAQHCAARAALAQHYSARAGIKLFAELWKEFPMELTQSQRDCLREGTRSLTWQHDERVVYFRKQLLRWCAPQLQSAPSQTSVASVQ